MKSSPYDPYGTGHRCVTRVPRNTKGSDDANRSESQKTDRNSDCRLKLVYMKVEQVVIDDQNASVKVILSVGLTARQ